MRVARPRASLANLSTQEAAELYQAGRQAPPLTAVAARGHKRTAQPFTKKQQHENNILQATASGTQSSFGYGSSREEKIEMI
jgi:hypothetical protein